jgi:hypothetical protein
MRLTRAFKCGFEASIFLRKAPMTSTQDASPKAIALESSMADSAVRSDIGIAYQSLFG